MHWTIWRRNPVFRQDWEAACTGDIACFDHWAKELVETGYLHNHARSMWFASIRIFTLRLLWVLGADFFLRHSLDGDPASNTLGWRWVSGLHTRGKTYLGRTDNIARYTEGRFNPARQLAGTAVPLDGPPAPLVGPVPMEGDLDSSKRTGLTLTPDNLNPGFLFERGVTPVETLLLEASDGLNPLAVVPHVTAVDQGALADVAERWQDRLGPITGPVSISAEIQAWADAEGLAQIVTAYAPVGPVADLLRQGPPVVEILRDCDARNWPHPTLGFFKFRERATY